MIKKLLLLAALPFAMTTQAADTFGGSEYFVVQTPMTWNSAEAYAQSVYGGHLVSIGGGAENQFLVDTFGGQNLFWIGFTDQASEGNFNWSDGSAVTYTNWGSGEPNNAGDEDAAVFNWGGPGVWNDLPTGAAHFFIVEVEQEVTPEPVPEVQHYASMVGAALIGMNVLRRRRAAK